VPAADYDVIVAGAGIAGLGAASDLAGLGLSCLVLEARDRVGGRTVNQEIAPGEVAELGGQWVGPGQDSILSLISELGLETFPTWQSGRHLFERLGRVTSYEGTIPRINPVALAELGLALRSIDRLAAGVDPSSPWAAPDAAKWDRTTVGTWLRRRLRTPAARDMLRLAIQAVWAAEPEDVSMLHLLFYVRSAGSLDALLAAEGGAQEARIVGGSQEIALRMAARLGDVVRLESPVSAVRHSGSDAPGRGDGWVEVDAPGGPYTARRLIVTLPPALAGRLEYDPPLPAARDGLTQRMAQGSVVKTLSVYDEPFWRSRGLSGVATSCDGPVSVVFDNTPPAGRPGVLLAFFEGAAARQVADLTSDERRVIVGRSLSRLFGPQAGSPTAYFDKSWPADRYSRGCYGGFMPPGAWTSHGPALRRATGPIHWAGAETAERWAGYMDGALTSGRRAAAEVARALGA
jgi:monoamine oxidase